jgi:hypothetical protein
MQSRQLSYVAKFTTDIWHILGSENIAVNTLARRSRQWPRVWSTWITPQDFMERAEPTPIFFLLDTNIIQNQNNKMPVASSFTFSPVQ